MHVVLCTTACVLQAWWGQNGVSSDVTGHSRVRQRYYPVWGDRVFGVQVMYDPITGEATTSKSTSATKESEQAPEKKRSVEFADNSAGGDGIVIAD